MEAIKPLPVWKRLMDMVVAVGAFLVLGPLFPLLALLVAVFLGRPVLFTQMRAGTLGKPFRLYKFRTMTDERDALGELLPDSQRLTRFGRFLRSTSLDELPELFNILKGEMSVVGPRPLPVAYVPRYSNEQARRLLVTPGLTGWAQVNGRNAVSWKKRFELDLWYIEHRSPMLDLKIIFLTFLKVFSRADISAEGCDTMHEFKGDTEG